MMRVFQSSLVVIILLLSLVTGAVAQSGAGKRNKKKGNVQIDRAGVQKEDQRVKQEGRNSTEGRFDNGAHKVVPLPLQKELMQDQSVEQGPVLRKFSGQDNSRMSCRGTVRGTTNGNPYFRYIKVDTSSCLELDIIYPRNHILSAEYDTFAEWQPAVTRLSFVGDNGRSHFMIPKRLSFPTNVTREAGSSDANYRNDERRGEQNLRTSFGFVVFFPPMDQQVNWEVEWQVDACSPFGDFDCSVDELKYDENAFSISEDEGFTLWSYV